MSHTGTLVLIMAAAVLAPLLAKGAARRIRVPLVIFEIALGILVGPDVLDWARSDQVVDVLADLGLAMLIFLAGYEIEFAAVRGTLRRAAGAWLCSLALGIALALWISGGDTYRAFVIGTALTSTALGTVLPILRDRGDLRTLSGRSSPRSERWASSGPSSRWRCCSAGGSRGSPRPCWSRSA